MNAFHVLSSAAAAFVIARAGVFAWLRRGPKGWVEFISCPLCVGFWVGFGLGVARLWLGKSSVFVAWQLVGGDVLDLVTSGALVGAVALLYTSVIDWLDALERAANRGEKPPDPQTDEIRQLVQEALQQPSKPGPEGSPYGSTVVAVKETDSWPKM